MKKVQVINHNTDVTVTIDWDNILYNDCKELSLKKGDDLGIFYRMNKGSYTFTNLNAYPSPYHPAEKLSFLVAKKPKLQELIDRFDLVLSV